MNASLLEDFAPGNNADLHETIFDAIPSPIFVVDSDLRVLDFNLAASTFLGEAPPRLSHPREGDLLQCVESFETEAGCGTAGACRNCGLRNSVRKTLGGGDVCRTVEPMRLIRNDQTIEVPFLITTAPVQDRGESLALLILDDLSAFVASRRIVLP